MRIFTNICASNLTASRDFYVKLLGLTVKFESDWYIQLCAPNNPDIEYGLIQQNHELVPKDFQQPPTGMYITFVVDNVDEVYEQALSLNLVIEQTPKNEFYGQRRFLLRDPNGCLLDICSPYSPSH